MIIENFDAELILLNKDLNQYYHEHFSVSSKYLVFLTLTQELWFSKDQFLVSLNSHTRENNFYEIYFLVSAIILNIYNVLINHNHVRIDSSQLFYNKRDCLETKYVCWNDLKHKLMNIIMKNLKNKIKLEWDSACQKSLIDVKDSRFFCEIQFKNSQESEHHTWVYCKMSKYHISLMKNWNNELAKDD